MPVVADLHALDEEPPDAGEVPLAALLQLIAALYQPPRGALRADLEAGGVAALCDDLAVAVGLPAPRASPPPWPALQATWVALFSANPAGLPAPPYVGQALDDELFGPGAERLARRLRGHGLVLADGWADLPVHVALVAEAGLLLVEVGRSGAARELLTEFLAPWLERYAAAVAEADPQFYGPLTLFLRDACREVTHVAAT